MAPVLIKLPELDSSTTMKTSFSKSRGRRPIAGFGNSDGDLPMLQWIMAGSGALLPFSFITTTRPRLLGAVAILLCV